MCIYYIDIGGLVLDCRISSVLTMEILQCCTKPPICSYCPQPMEFGGHRNRLVCCFVCLSMQCSNLSHFSGFRIFLEKTCWIHSFWDSPGMTNFLSCCAEFIKFPGLWLVKQFPVRFLDKPLRGLTSNLLSILFQAVDISGSMGGSQRVEYRHQGAASGHLHARKDHAQSETWRAHCE